MSLVKPYELYRAHAGSLNFESNEFITVFESPKLTSACSSSSVGLNAEFNSNNIAALNWRGFILNRDNYTTRFGYFPSSYVKMVESTNIDDSAINNSKRPTFLTSSTTSLLLAQNSSKPSTHLNSDLSVDNISVIEKVMTSHLAVTASLSGHRSNTNEAIYSSNIKFKEKNEKQDAQVRIHF